MKLRKIKLRMFSLFTMAISFAFILTSCHPNQDKTTATNADTSKTVHPPLVENLDPSDKQIDQFISDLKPQREKLLAAIENDYPGLYKQYEDDSKKITALKNEKDIGAALTALDKKYKDKFQKAYTKANIDQDLIEAAKNLFSNQSQNVGYKIGNLGTISAMAMADSAGAVLAADSTANFNCPFDVQEHYTSCNLIGSDELTYVGDCSLSAGNLSLFIAGCGSNSHLGLNIAIPSAYNTLTSTFNINYHLKTMAIAIIGGAYCEAMVGSQIDEGSTHRVKGEFAKIWSLAPIIWYNSSEDTRTNQNLSVTYNRDGSSVPTVTPKLYCEANGGAGLFAGSVPSSWIERINSLQMRMQH